MLLRRLSIALLVVMLASAALGTAVASAASAHPQIPDCNSGWSWRTFVTDTESTNLPPGVASFTFGIQAKYASTLYCGLGRAFVSITADSNGYPFGYADLGYCYGSSGAQSDCAYHIYGNTSGGTSIPANQTQTFYSAVDDGNGYLETVSCGGTSGDYFNASVNLDTDQVYGSNGCPNNGGLSLAQMTAPARSGPTPDYVDCSQTEEVTVQSAGPYLRSGDNGGSFTYTLYLQQLRDVNTQDYCGHLRVYVDYSQTLLDCETFNINLRAYPSQAGYSSTNTGLICGQTSTLSKSYAIGAGTGCYVAHFWTDPYPENETETFYTCI